MELLKVYDPPTKVEKGYLPKMLKLLAKKGTIACTRENKEAHFTASAWIINPHDKEVLLLHHKKLKKWLQPGGHADGEMNLEIVARKEANEETGLENLTRINNQIFDIDIHTIPEHKGIAEHKHYDVRFAYFCTNKDETQINLESNDFQWINLNQIESLTDEPSILRMVEKSKNILNGL
ncbi:NUDIX hydrolase [Marivirga sp.]|uniref:NUDIX hydrolase n=1 Tax=Marivirga sp. TaxID=2018662 RepID=UPI002D7E5277|nr:NUDIX hydrolase [Marivirga sp.]HET8858830.1 NUDIX hydrolase [Marivirga sp.]